MSAEEERRAIMAKAAGVSEHTFGVVADLVAERNELRAQRDRLRKEVRSLQPELECGCKLDIDSDIELVSQYLRPGDMTTD